MEYVEIKLLKQSEKSTIHLVREKDGEQVFIRKRLKGRQDVYQALKSCPHTGLPRLYEVELSEHETIVVEEYIKGQLLGSVELSESQLLGIVRELCDVLAALHGRGIIHRDLKPSNIILAQDGHIRLIDFDAARVTKAGMESDTRLLGTRGYAPPEQYGFAQTDARTDIYALGVTLEQVLGDQAQKPRYRYALQKCMRLDPEKRYQSVKQFERAFFYGKRNVLCGVASLLLLLAAFSWYLYTQFPVNGHTALTALPAPENPHWNGDTGVALWENVPDSGKDGEVAYHWRLYWEETAVPPDLEKDNWEKEGSMRGNNWHRGEEFNYQVNLSAQLEKNGFYYFAVSAEGDGEQYADSSYVISDVFQYTGESAPPLPSPAGLQWKRGNMGEQMSQCFAVWSNLDAYENMDSFNVRVYNASGDFVGNNIWTKEQILSLGYGGIWIDPQMLPEEGGPYRFTVQVYSSRPNEFSATFLPNPVPEEAFSPWSDMGAS